jgi:hypothetical protein
LVSAKFSFENFENSVPQSQLPEFGSFFKMNAFRCFFHERESRRVAECDVWVTWSVSFLRARVQALFGIPVRTLKFNRRLISNSERLSNLNLKDRSTFFVNSPTLDVDTQQRNSGEPQLRNTNEVPDDRQPLQRPMRSRAFSPEAIEERIKKLEDLGFPRADCEKALQSALFNVDRAADYLVNGSIPEPLVLSFQ